MIKLFTLSGLAALLALGGQFVQAQGAADPDEISDVLERAKARGKLVACADPFNYPYSLQASDPPGFDVEIIREIAKLGGMRLEIYWADTGSRGGTSRAFRNSIMKGRCDVFTGMSDSGDDDMLMGKLTFTEPYLGLGYVLVVQGKAQGKQTLKELKDASIKVGVPMSTPIDDYLFMQKIPRELYLDNRRIMQGMSKGEVDAAIVWATAVALAKREYPDGKFAMVSGYVPVEGQRWDLRYVARKSDRSLIEFLNSGIKQLLANGKLKQIIESYGVPFYPPFSS